MDYYDVRVFGDQSAMYPFPNEQAAIRFAHGCLSRGWAVELEAHMAGKSLRPAPKGTKSLRRARIRLEPLRVSADAAKQHGLTPLADLLTMKDADTYYVLVGGVNETMVTVMADGLEIAWDSCGSCTNHVRLCRCRYIMPSRAIQTIAYKTAGMKAGQKWEDVQEPVKPADDTPRQIVYPWREKPQKKSLYTKTKPVPPKSLPPTNGKPLRAATKPKKEPTIEVDSSFKLSSLDSAAERSAGDAMAALSDRLFAGRKSLRK